MTESGYPMKTSELGQALISSFEGYSAKAYQDQRGIWTIAFGHTLGVKEGDTCTHEQAISWLAEDLEVAEHVVNQVAKTEMLNQNRFDALVSLTYNIGSGNFAHSTLVRLLNGGDAVGASAQFLVWCRTNGETNPGLMRRRVAERKLFDTPI